MAAAKSTVAKRTAKSPGRQSTGTREIVGADDPKMVVGLQASFSIQGKLITLNTDDISKLKDGIKFHLDEPVELPTLEKFLEWAGGTSDKPGGAIPDFPPVNTSDWPAPFDGLAKMTVTINELRVDTTGEHKIFTIDVLIKANPEKKPVIPFLNIAIESFGVRASNAGDDAKPDEKDKKQLTSGNV